MFFAFIVRLFIELSLETCLCFMINILVWNFNSFGEYASFLLSILFLIVNFTISIFLPFFIIRSIQKEQEEKCISYLGEIAEGLNYSYKPRASAIYHSLIFWRRVVFVATVFVLGETYLQFCIHLFIITHILYIAYLIQGRPTEGGIQSELFNEICTLLLSYLMFIYTDY